MSKVTHFYIMSSVQRAESKGDQQNRDDQQTRSAPPAPLSTGCAGQLTHVLEPKPLFRPKQIQRAKFARVPNDCFVSSQFLHRDHVGREIEGGNTRVQSCGRTARIDGFERARLVGAR